MIVRQLQPTSRSLISIHVLIILTSCPLHWLPSLPSPLVAFIALTIGCLHCHCHCPIHCLTYITRSHQFATHIKDPLSESPLLTDNPPHAA